MQIGRDCVARDLSGVKTAADLYPALCSITDSYYRMFLDNPVMRDIWTATQADRALQQLDAEDGAYLAGLLVGCGEARRAGNAPRRAVGLLATDDDADRRRGAPRHHARAARGEAHARAVQAPSAEGPVGAPGIRALRAGPRGCAIPCRLLPCRDEPPPRPLALRRLGRSRAGLPAAPRGRAGRRRDHRRRLYRAVGGAPSRRGRDQRRRGRGQQRRLGRLGAERRPAPHRPAPRPGLARSRSSAATRRGRCGGSPRRPRRSPSG